MTVAPSVPVPLALGAVAGFAGRGFACDGRLGGGCGAIRTAMPVAIMARRPALVGAATGPPDLDQFGLGGRGGCVRGRRFADGSGLRRCFGGCLLPRLLLRRRLDYTGLGRSLDGSFGRTLRLGLRFDGGGLARARFACARLRRKRDIGEQRHRGDRDLFSGRWRFGSDVSGRWFVRCFGRRLRNALGDGLRSGFRCARSGRCLGLCRRSL